jgi:ribonuclease D
MRDATYVATPEALAAATFRLQGARRLAIDTEFMRERTYYPQLCLVQVASDTDCYLFDPLAGLDLAPLFATIADRARPKILHAARQDLEVMLHVGGTVPGPIFDTQVAGGLLGLPPQAGYADLVARRLGHSIDKGQTRTDWSRRPLSDAQLAYAADDVHHLLELHTGLKAELLEKGRDGWLVEDCAALEAAELYRTVPADAWRRLKGIGRLRPEEQAAARSLAEWRESRAIASDKPRGWILSDEALFAMATLAPRTPADLEAIRSLPPGVASRRGEELIRLVQAARESVEPGPAPPPPAKPTPAQAARIAALQALVRSTATELAIQPEVLATRRDVEALVFGPREASGLLHGWRHALVGARIEALAG